MELNRSRLHLVHASGEVQLIEASGLLPEHRPFRPEDVDLAVIPNGTCWTLADFDDQLMEVQVPFFE
ncbi:MAG: hypothetical protein V1778_03700, partial [bacterium]